MEQFAFTGPSNTRVNVDFIPHDIMEMIRETFEGRQHNYVLRIIHRVYLYGPRNHLFNYFMALTVKTTEDYYRVMLVMVKYVKIFMSDIDAFEGLFHCLPLVQYTPTEIKKALENPSMDYLFEYNDMVHKTVLPYMVMLQSMRYVNLEFRHDYMEVVNRVHERINKYFILLVRNVHARKYAHVKPIENFLRRYHTVAFNLEIGEDCDFIGSTVRDVSVGEGSVGDVFSPFPSDMSVGETAYDEKIFEEEDYSWLP